LLYNGIMTSTGGDAKQPRGTYRGDLINI